MALSWISCQLAVRRVGLPMLEFRNQLGECLMDGPVVYREIGPARRAFWAGVAISLRPLAGRVLCLVRFSFLEPPTG